MSKLCWILVLVVTVLALPARSFGQMTPGQMTPPQEEWGLQHSMPTAGASLGAAVSNIFYVPVRLLISVVTAEVGGFTGWMIGGDEAAARAVWQSTDGQGFIRPEVFEGRERLRFGPWQ